MTSLSENTVVTTSGGLVELGYSQITSNLSVTGTSTAQTQVIAPLTVVCDGSPILVEFFSANIVSPSSQYLTISLWEDGVEKTRYWATSGISQQQSSAPKYRLTPSAGTHTYAVRAFTTSGTGTVAAGTGSTTETAPAFLRVSKIIQASQFIVPLASAPLVTSLPSTGNIDGQEVRYLIDDTSGTMWNLRWRASANRWEPISGFENDRNRIINGAMLIDQRRSNVVANSQTDVFVADRFRFYASGGGNANVQCLTNDGPTGVSTNSARITVATQDTSLAAGDYYFIRQNIEGYNVQDLGFGTSANKIVTLSFYVKSSVTGTFGGSFKNDALNRSYTFSYTINAANTWERKIVTFTADNTGTWEKTTTGGLIINWSLGQGSSFTTSNINTWESANYNQPSGSTNLMATAAATWQLSGVQLELGPTATPFQTRSFEEELRKSQRYFYKTPSIIMSNYVFFNSGNVSTTSMPFPVRMRANPIITYYDGSGNINKVSFFVANGSNSDNNNPPAAYSATTDFWRFSAGGALSYTSPYTGHLYVSYEASSEIS